MLLFKRNVELLVCCFTISLYNGLFLLFFMLFSKKLLISLITVGIIAGCTGVALSHLLHGVQHFAYQYATDGQEIPFLIGVSQSSGSRRFCIVLLCGFLATWGWYWLHRYWGKPIAISQALTQPEQGLPLFRTLYHGLLQIITVGLGSPLGREVAPREISSALASLWANKFKLDTEEKRLLIACAAGAGLAAIYNVPLAGIVFTLETLLLTWSAIPFFATLITCTIATLISRMGLGDLVQYHLIDSSLNTALLYWSAVIGPLIGIIVYLFRKTTRYFPWVKRDDKRILLMGMASFFIIALLAIYFPAILGNGKAGNQLSFWGLIGWHDSLILMLVKWFVILLALAAGAYGGLITPSMMLGSTFALTSVFLWHYIGLPSIPLESAALIGATAFLAISLNMPITALIFCLELTRVSPAFLFPMIIATTGAYLTMRYLNHKATQDS